MPIADSRLTDQVHRPAHRPAWRRLKQSRMAWTGLALVGVLAALALAAGTVAPYGYDEMIRGHEGLSPSGRHWFGTDRHGGDVFTRGLYGGRVSLFVGFAATLVAVTIGVAVGLAGGYFGGWVEAVLMRLTDVVFAFPSILLAIAIQAAVDADGMLIVAAILGVVGWPGIARVVRSQVLSVRELDYVAAAKTLGAGHARIMLRHVLPNIIGPVIVMATLAVGGNILSEAGLSFLGLGTQEPIPSWGKMLADGKEYLRTLPWLTVAPGLAIVLTVLGINLLGDGLRDALDPRMKLR